MKSKINKLKYNQQKKREDSSMKYLEVFLDVVSN